MLNVNEVMAALERRYGRLAELELRYMENATLAEQVAMWSGASLVLHMHGAALGNWVFLPHSAVAVVLTLASDGEGRFGLGDIFPHGLVGACFGCV